MKTFIKALIIILLAVGFGWRLYHHDIKSKSLIDTILIDLWYPLGQTITNSGESLPLWIDPGTPLDPLAISGENSTDLYEQRLEYYRASKYKLGIE